MSDTQVNAFTISRTSRTINIYEETDVTVTDGRTVTQQSGQWNTPTKFLIESVIVTHRWMPGTEQWLAGRQVEVRARRDENGRWGAPQRHTWLYIGDVAEVLQDVVDAAKPTWTPPSIVA